MEKKIMLVDDDPEMTTKLLKEMWGLRPDQSFQDLDVEIDKDEEVAPPTRGVD